MINQYSRSNTSMFNQIALCAAVDKYHRDKGLERYVTFVTLRIFNDEILLL